MKDVLIRNEKELNEKIERIRKDGVSHLHVVADFDRTLTPAFVEGKKTPTVIAQLREGKYLTPDYPTKAYALHDEYYPIETAKDIPLELKRKKMYEWWSRHLKLIVECGMNRKVVEDIVNKKMVKYRKGVKDFLELLAKHKIPIVILSAALGDVIEYSLKSEGMFHSNIHVISDFFKFDEKGNALGYKSDIIHVFNKNEGQIRKSEHYAKIKDRKNVILLGDSFGDTEMLEGLEHKTIIKIGFLNDNAMKEQFLKEYDVLVLNDGTMDYVNELLNSII